LFLQLRRTTAPAALPESGFVWTLAGKFIGKMRENRERREHFRWQREERERQEKNEGFLPHSLYICCPWHKPILEPTQSKPDLFLKPSPAPQLLFRAQSLFILFLHPPLLLPAPLPCMFYYFNHSFLHRMFNLHHVLFVPLHFIFIKLGISCYYASSFILAFYFTRVDLECN